MCVCVCVCVQGSTLVLAIRMGSVGDADFSCSALGDTARQGLSLLGLAQEQMPEGTYCNDLGDFNRLLFVSFPEDDTAKTVVETLANGPEVASALMSALEVRQRVCVCVSMCHTLSDTDTCLDFSLWPLITRHCRFHVLLCSDLMAS